MAEYKLPYSGAEIARRLEQAGKVDAIETEISQIPKIYPVIGIFNTDPSTWGDPLPTKRRDPWYAIF